MSQNTPPPGDRLNEALDAFEKLIAEHTEKAIRQLAQAAADVVEAVNKKLQS